MHRLDNTQIISVTGVAYDPQGQLALLGQHDGTLVVWDVTTGEIVRRLDGLEDAVTALAFGADGRTVLAGDERGALAVWNVEQTEPVVTFQGHEAEVRAVALSPDGRTALSGASDGTLTLWELGDQVLATSATAGGYTTRLTIPDHRPGVATTWWLDISAEIDYATGEVTWTFRTLDPATGELPDDALAGFLPPNDSTGRGEGHVSFSVRPRADRPIGTVVTNKATITFDQEASITTNEVFNTLGFLLYLPQVTLNSHSPRELEVPPIDLLHE